VPPARVFAWHLDQAEAALRERQYSAASLHLGHLNSAEPPSQRSRWRRGHLFLLRGEWERAAADFAAVLDAGESEDSEAWLDYARLLVLRGDQVAYRRLVPRMLAHCGPDTEIYTPELVEACACVLAPGGLEDPAQAVRLAERVVKAGRKGDTDPLLTLGLAHYRAGDWEKALARAEEAVARRPEAAWAAWPLLALAHARLGREGEARRWLEKAEERYRQERRLIEESAGFGSGEGVDFEILRREAAALLGVRKITPAGPR
jgi:tetratricopeptide (TPR) repeat protein